MISASTPCGTLRPPRCARDRPGGTVAGGVIQLPHARIDKSGTPLVYSNDSPGFRIGCLPTTPVPRTSSTFPAPSVMIQWRVRSWTASGPSFEIVTL